LKCINNQQIKWKNKQKTRLLWGIFTFLWGIETVFDKKDDVFDKI